MAFKVGDRVRFIRQGYGHQNVGHIATVIGLDGDGDPICDSDALATNNVPTLGWGSDTVEMVDEPDHTPTLRDQFAMAALTVAGYMVGEMRSGDVETIGYENAIAGAAYSLADALLAAREAK